MVFLDPLWQTVIATAQWNGKGEPNLNVRLAPRDVHNLPLDEVTRGVYQLYMSSEFVRVEDSWTLAMSKQKWIWHLSNIEGEAGCAYPRRIILEFSEHHAVVEVTTKSMSCTD
ncbi:MAG: hypothetical protein NTX25_04230 [Proteobacteria bacterium]|nr:hypothetical protein [Pseudomonadota bacterium]